VQHLAEIIERARDPPLVPGAAEQLEAARDVLVRELPDVQINGRGEPRLPNTSSIFIPGVRADDLIVAMDLERILISSGAACTSGKPEPSHVLLAMGQDEARSRATIRVSFRADLQREMVPRMVNALASAVARMRSVVKKG
jgi:cysteine desulfurase